jgi:hypothetical protein
MRSAAEVLLEADRCSAQLEAWQPMEFNSVASIRTSFVGPARSYYALAALSRRKVVTAMERDNALGKMFALRALLEQCMLAALERNESELDVVSYAARSSFFGRSIKQGVSVRYPLATCIPTKLCGGRCYAHDGRDRDLQRLFRGVLNWYLGGLYEFGDSEKKRLVMASLSTALDDAIAAAFAERDAADREGFQRSPRIRFSHVGDMASTPQFANALAQEIKSRAPNIRCVIYTRHPLANRFDSKLFVVNFTVDGEDDPRISYKPADARLVSSSWNGKLLEGAEVNFVEHHVEKSTKPLGSGQCCPVTLNHDATPSCDSALCEKCFVPPVRVQVRDV